ncbi:hypothetical protein MASR1M90_10190 [Desulfovibrionales bacterium]
MAEIKIKPQPFPIKDVIAASDRFAHQLGVILRQDIGGHVFHGNVELARNRLITTNAVLSSWKWIVRRRFLCQGFSKIVDTQK